MTDARYDRNYYAQYDVGTGKIDYETNQELKNFHALIADRIVQDLQPKTVLDVGCAMGHLVAALRDRGVAAYGVDVSEYAISRVREDIKPYCAVGSIVGDFPADFPRKYDLVVTIEVFEHIAEELAAKAVENLCSLSDHVLFASTPDDFDDPTHINVRQREFWTALFAKQGFFDNLQYRPQYLAEHAIFFKRSNDWMLQLEEYERDIRLTMGEIKRLKDKFGISKQIVTVLIDSGKGFSEKDRIYSCHTTEEDYVNIGITVPVGGKIIRIDPVQGYPCMVSEVTVRACDPGVTITLKEHNGVCVEDHFLFECTQPQMIYAVEGVTPCVVQIIATVTVFPTAEIVRRIQRLLHGVESQWRANTDQIMASAAQHLQEIERCKQDSRQAMQLAQEYREKNQKLEEAVTQQCEEIKESKRMLDGYAAQEVKYKNTIQRYSDKLQELKTVSHEANDLKNRLAQKELELETVSARLATSNIQLIQTLDQLKSAKSTLDGVVNSRSWKVTAPLRRFTEKLRKKKPVQTEAPVPPVPEAAPVAEPPVPACEPADPVNTADPADMLPESLYKNRPEVEDFLEKLQGYDVVSFDIFDTLILRTFDKPTDVFRLIGHRIGEESFAKLRVQAEQEARAHHQDKNGEVNIYEIYEELSKYLAIDPKAVIRQELEAEKDCCFANPFMKAVFDALLCRGQKVIIVSDMYLPGELVAQLLHSCGYDGYAGLYVSCDHGAGKWNKKLYDIVERDNPECRSYVHVGDNYISDFEHARKNGWDAVFYPSCRELGGQLRPAGMDRLSVSAYNGIVNAHLHADSAVYTPEYEHGFRYAGYLVCGFCEWLNKYAEENHIDRILFLARDADVIHKVYNRFYRKVDNRYMVVSRLATWIMAFETDTEAFIQNFFQTRANLGTQKIGEALEETDMAVLIPLLEDAGLFENDRLTQSNYQALRSFILENKAVVAEHYAPSKAAGLDYFREMIGDAKRVCAVDIGWSGQIMITMRKIIRDLYHGEVTLKGAYLALTDNMATSGFVEAGIITPWMFHGCMNRDIAINTATVEGDMQTKFTEATFTSDQATLLKYIPDANGKPDFVYGITSAAPKLVKQMQEGVLDFAAHWQQRTHMLYPYLQIMPADAKGILDHAIKNYRYSYAIMGQIREWEFSLPNFKGEGSLTTLGAIAKRRGFV